MANSIQIGDEGVALRMTIYTSEDETTAYDLSGAGNLKMILGAPDGEVITLTSSNGVGFATDGSDGIVSYAIEAAATHDPTNSTPVIHTAGDWEMQIEWTQSGSTRRSTVATFEVKANIETQETDLTDEGDNE